MLSQGHPPLIPEDRGRAMAHSPWSGVSPHPSFFGRSTTRATTDAIFEPKPELFQSVRRQQPVDGKGNVDTPEFTSSAAENEPPPSSRRARSVPGRFHAIEAPSRQKTSPSDRFPGGSRGEPGAPTT